MHAPELAESPAAAPAGAARQLGRAAAVPSWATWVALALLLAGGLTLRLLAAGQSLFADELSTYWISAQHGLGGVLSLLYGTGRIHHAEITPPLSFLASWLTTRFGSSPELLRVPSLIAGTATIGLVYLVGTRTAGRRAALVAAAITALAPFTVYYSSEARAYALMMAFVLGATLSLLLALDTGLRRWWVLYALCSCAAFYSHYTCAFVLAVQLAWVLWRAPAARRAPVIANAGAAVLVLPWLPGLVNDLHSPTLTILSGLSPFTLHDVGFDLSHWAFGYPNTLGIGLRDLPGTLALVALALAGALTCAGLAAAARTRRLRLIEPRVRLLIALALTAPVGEIVLSALGDHILDVRNMASSWPFAALSCSVALARSTRWVRPAVVALALVGFGIGGVKIVSSRYERPDYRSAARFVAREAHPGDVVVDETGALSPGPLTGLDVYLHTRLSVLRAEAPAERDHPFGFADPIMPLAQAMHKAAAAAAGHRVFLVSGVFRVNVARLQNRVNPALSGLGAGYRLIQRRRFAGFGATEVSVYAPARAARP